MAEENETAKPTQYAIHSMVRSIHNRTARAAMPQKPRRKQYVGADQLRLAHGRPLIINETQLQANLAELRAKALAHVLEVRTMDGRRVDLTTLEIAALPSQPPKPNFPLDSVHNDKNYPGIPGHLLSNAVGGDDLTMPQVLKGDDKPALFKESAAHVADLEDTATSAPADIDALVDAAQADGGDEEGDEAAPAAKEEVSSDKPSKSGSKKRGR